MTDIDVSVDFNPAKLKAFSRNESQMAINITNLSDTGTYWCECELVVPSPLSLSPDSALNDAKMRVGLLKPHRKATKAAKLYTMPNNYPDDYAFNIIVFFYDEDGAIAERAEKKASIVCAATDSAAAHQQ